MNRSFGDYNSIRDRAAAEAAARESFENANPLTAVATLLGRKWHLVILDELLEGGPQGFSALQRQIGGISSKVLSESLSDLEEKELISRAVVCEKPFRVEYSLTERGEALQPVITAARESSV
ncbi:winged helix-turn-helix transcriptional regulator [Haloarchaeobius sp. HME9146]|uniref:winged helix-turn-helix transcriptional regulator n=1 Tax=unclassified Haloarchaeobius TaxID=2614452 RepID=UPI0021C21D1A|nr:helix-turn-helix domain-containing protein [Haloarchaeobius sp. HME9146]MCT9098380.1 helix-turn-helix transcriptional regulator [Haloarchaeobius sp. HME9146]